MKVSISLVVCVPDGKREDLIKKIENTNEFDFRGKNNCNVLPRDPAKRCIIDGEVIPVACLSKNQLIFVNQQYPHYPQYHAKLRAVYEHL